MRNRHAEGLRRRWPILPSENRRILLRLRNIPAESNTVAVFIEADVSTTWDTCLVPHALARCALYHEHRGGRHGSAREASRGWAIFPASVRQTATTQVPPGTGVAIARRRESRNQLLRNGGLPGAEGRDPRAGQGRQSRGVAAAMALASRGVRGCAGSGLGFSGADTAITVRFQ
jgi:hypothetical protein